MKTSSKLQKGSAFMLVGALSFIGYGIVFLLRSLYGAGFELGVDTLGGFAPSDLAAISPEIAHYIDHLHIAVSGFIISTGIAVTALVHYGVRKGLFWAWSAAVAAPVVALAIALPMHYLNVFSYDWTTHLGPIYIGTLLFVIGADFAFFGIREVKGNRSGKK